MVQYLAIVVYRCLIAGVRDGSLDVQVQWHEADDEAAVRSAIAAEPLHSYENSDGEIVTWEFSDVMAVEPFSRPEATGQELIGFIASIRELRKLA